MQYTPEIIKRQEANQKRINTVNRYVPVDRSIFTKTHTERVELKKRKRLSKTYDQDGMVKQILSSKPPRWGDIRVDMFKW